MIKYDNHMKAHGDILHIYEKMWGETAKFPRVAMEGGFNQPLIFGFIQRIENPMGSGRAP